MTLTTCENINRPCYVLGIVTAVIVLSASVVRDTLAGVKNLAGGELRPYSALLEQAVQEVLRRLEANARGLGADAVIGVRFSTSHITTGAAEILAYGTAVKFTSTPEPRP